jgi:predicted ABC-type ATPase
MKKGRIRPQLYVIAGPNGAGKTTFARKFLPLYVECIEFINVDLIADGISPFAPERASIQAGRIMLEQIHLLSSRSCDFSFETTLSGKTYIKFLKDLKKKGYQIHLYFLWITTVDLALERIATRVRSGGHDISEVIVRRRFNKSLSHFFKLYQPLVDSWTIFDNSSDVPKMIAFEESGKLKIIEPEIFDTLLKHMEK